MACKKIGFCEYVINEFVYEKACTGRNKTLYCPLFKEGYLKLPKEWRSIQTSVPSLKSSIGSETP